LRSLVQELNKKAGLWPACVDEEIACFINYLITGTKIALQ